MLNKIKKNQKGFTLVEVIVVLVILAILAAILVPTLTGYIDKANERALIAETRAAVMAAQTLVSEKYGDTGTTQATVDVDAVKTLAEVTGTLTVTVAGNKVTGATYKKDAAGKTCTYTASPAANTPKYKVA